MAFIITVTLWRAYPFWNNNPVLRIFGILFDLPTLIREAEDFRRSEVRWFVLHQAIYWLVDIPTFFALFVVVVTFWYAKAVMRDLQVHRYSVVVVVYISRPLGVQLLPM